MINATGFNFGQGNIQFRDYQSEDMVILNGKFSYDQLNSRYREAEQLEIYVPDLSIDKSAPTAVYVHGEKNGEKYITAVKSWIKNKNTIALEKPPLFNSSEYYNSFDFFSAYVPKGVRFEPQLMAKTPLTITSEDIPDIYIYFNQCVVTDNWIFLALKLGNCRTATEGEQFTINLGGMPSWPIRDIPMFCNAYWAASYGSYDLRFSINGSELKCLGRYGRAQTETAEAMTRLFIVR